MTEPLSEEERVRGREDRQAAIAAALYVTAGYELDCPDMIDVAEYILSGRRPYSADPEPDTVLPYLPAQPDPGGEG